MEWILAPESFVWDIHHAAYKLGSIRITNSGNSNMTSNPLKPEEGARFSIFGTGLRVWCMFGTGTRDYCGVHCIGVGSYGHEWSHVGSWILIRRKGWVVLYTLGSTWCFLNIIRFSDILLKSISITKGPYYIYIYIFLFRVQLESI